MDVTDVVERLSEKERAGESDFDLGMKECGCQAVKLQQLALYLLCIFNDPPMSS
jgi:hypothetical protein